MTGRFGAQLVMPVSLALALQVSLGCEPFGNSTAPAADASATDASTNPPLPGDGGDAGFCSDKVGALLCDDFERSEVLGPWSALSASTGGGMLSIDDATATSPRRSLRALLPATLESGQVLRHDIPDATTFLEISFSMRFDELPGKANPTAADDVQVVALHTASGTSPVFLLASTEYGVRLAQQADNDFRSVPVGRPPLGVFVRYAIRFDLSTATATATMGTSAPVSQTVEVPFDGPKTISLGNVYAGPQETPRNVWFDDVVLTVR